MKISIIGAGSFGTAIATQLVKNSHNNVVLYSRDSIQVESIKKYRINKKYYPNITLNPKIHISNNQGHYIDSDIIFISVPSSQIKQVAPSLKNLKKDTIIVNLSKGIFDNGQTIVEYLREYLKNENVMTMKGATFASEMMNNSASLFTLGFDKIDQYRKIKQITEGTDIYLDYTSDIRGVEILSVLKNIYAILIGIVDAKFNSANTRFMILTKSFSEIKKILRGLGGKEDTLFLSAGFGDISLTSLNDLSRNRTLGLLIGKGFFNSESITNFVVLEGVTAVNVVHRLKPKYLKNQTNLLDKLHDYFNGVTNGFEINFNALVERTMKVVLTYGTFDLLHYGHLEVLRRSKVLGDKLIVGLSTDEFNLEKGKNCVIPYEKRKELLESLEFVDLVIPENDWNQKITDVQNNNVDIFVMGDDWEGKFDFLKEYCEVLYLERTKGISTTKLKRILND
uniref:glycerol-3-phosphate cytidylyltransferase n=1 Tax=Polaribacter sp. TaxID=1920175 RepID=UPI004047AC08